MANEIVKYNNELNLFPLKDFTEYDLNFLMAICAKMKDLGEELQVFEYKQLMELIEWDASKSIMVFHKDLMRMAEKLRHVGGTLETVEDDVFVSFNLFTTFEGSRKNRTLKVRVNPQFKYILNDLSKNFTRFELKEYVKLEGKYSKLLYQNLKQYRKTGWWQVSVDDLRSALSIPESVPTRNILTKLISPSLEIIRTCKGFSDLEVEVLRSDRRGRAVIGYKFKFTPDNQIKGQMSIEDYQKTTAKRKKKKDQTTNFEQRNYDYDELEKLLVDN